MSVYRDSKTGRWVIQIVGIEGNKKTLRPGRLSKEQAQNMERHIEKLRASRVSGSAIDLSTSEWLAGLPVKIRSWVSRHGFIELEEVRKVYTVEQWIDKYIEGRTDWESGTKVQRVQAKKDAVRHFGKARTIDSITPADADGFQIAMKTKKGRRGKILSEGTARVRIKRVKEFFEAAVKAKLIDENPFAGIKCGNFVDKSRQYYVSLEEIAAVLDACPDAEFRLIVALNRFAGLRMPSEVFALRWMDIDWDKEKIIVHDKKNKRHEGRDIRVIPFFNNLRPYLFDAHEAAELKEEYVVTRHRIDSGNLRPQMKRIIEKAKLKVWPKLFQNMRSSCETDLVEEHPIHVVTYWLGNTPAVAKKHYLQVTEDHYEKARRNPRLQVAEMGCMEEQGENGEIRKPNVFRAVRGDANPCNSKGLHQLTPRRLELRLPG